MLSYGNPTALKQGSAALRSAIQEFLFGSISRAPRVGWFCRRCSASGTVPSDGDLMLRVARAHKQVAATGCPSIRQVVIRKALRAGN